MSRRPQDGTTSDPVRIYLELFGYCVEVPEGETIVGRDVSCGLRFNDSTVSRHHARLVRDGELVHVEDVGSTNGTQLNACLIDRPTQLRDGDELCIGAYALKLVVVSAEADELTTRKVASLSEIGAIGRQHRTATPRRSTASFQAMERRTSDRKPLELRVVYTSPELEIEASTYDISSSGVFMCSHVLDPIGTPCELTILIDGGPALRVRGIVRRVVEHDGFRSDPIGLGIEFIELGAAERDWLELALARMTDATKTVTDGSPIES
ncbi:MAG TPA: FHA domain-containing protein [Kofleriaceae bacterium]|nr:FHA domain-containing protein [Kofleriaceae bacterium]